KAGAMFQIQDQQDRAGNDWQYDHNPRHSWTPPSAGERRSNYQQRCQEQLQRQGHHRCGVSQCSELGRIASGWQALKFLGSASEDRARLTVVLNLRMRTILLRSSPSWRQNDLDAVVL